MGEVTLVGTAHVSKKSVKEVEDTILREKPRYVALELCRQRYEALTERKKWMDTPISNLIRSGRVYFLLAYTLLSSLERKLSEVTGVRPGDEMIAGARAGRKVGAEVVLVDRPIQITLKRAWKKAKFREKLRLFREIFFGLFGLDEIDEDAIEELKKTDVMSRMLQELGKALPSVKKVFIDERDAYIAAKLRELDGKTVAVVGAGHLRGIRRELRKKGKVKLDALEEIPTSRFRPRWLFYGVTVLIISMFVILAFSNPARLPESIFLWCVINIVFTAIGGLVALGHPASIAAGAFSSPVTSLLPNIGAGWVAGIVEAKIRKPTVRDIEGLRDISGPRDLWRNRFSKVLVLAAFVNVGSTIGTFVALPYVLSLL